MQIYGNVLENFLFNFVFQTMHCLLLGVKMCEMKKKMSKVKIERDRKRERE